MRSTARVVSLFAAALAGCGDNLETPGNGSGSDSSESFVIGGTVSGLAADGLVLVNNGGDALTVASTASSFEFATKVARGADYSVTVQSQPTGELCTVSGGTGTANAAVLAIRVTCRVEQSVATQWTWEGGSDVANGGVAGVYGTLGIADGDNMPGGRQQAASWRDHDGNLWMFGGYGVDSTGAGGQLDDLWKYDPKAGEWTWVSGTNVAPPSGTGGAAGSSGVYGTQGVADPANVPGGREQIATWVDAQGVLYVFGGEGIDTNGVSGELNDLWKYDGGQWTWLGGSNSVGAALVFGGPSGVYGTKGTASATNIPGGRYGSVSWTDADGNFWLFGGSGIDSQPFMGQIGYLNDLWKYSPAQNTWTWVAGADTFPSVGGGASGVYGTLGTGATTNYPGGRDAAMSWVDASGNVWIFGGIGIDSTGTLGFENDLWKYEPGTGKWTWVSGSSTVDNGGHSGVYGTRGTADAANVPGGRFSGSTWVDGSGKLWLLGGQGFDSTTNFVVLNDLWSFDPTTSKWTWVSGSDTAGNNGGQPGVYGTLGTSAAANVPGARFGAPSWFDPAGNLWLFGGSGYDADDNMANLNDLWKYQL